MIYVRIATQHFIILLIISTTLNSNLNTFKLACTILGNLLHYLFTEIYIKFKTMYY